MQAQGEIGMKIGIIGAGNMGSGLGKLFAKNGHEVMFSFSHDPHQIEQVVIELVRIVDQARPRKWRSSKTSWCWPLVGEP
jgi:glycerol-3-phosphate dehydrogenase